MRRCLRIVLTPETEFTVGARIETLAQAHPMGIAQPDVMPREKLDALLPRGAVHQGVAALVEAVAETSIEDICRATESEATARIVVLDQVTDPHNVGAVIRSAAAFGAAAVVLPERHSPPATGTLAKAASGALERVPLVRTVNLARALEQLKQAGFWCVGLDAMASQTLNEADLSGKIALVLGAEGEGLRRLTRDKCDLMVRIPIAEGVESLNVSNAAAVGLYELARRG
jgi:23S rRNA (guanosine2251-2'-O)-methyltransferase